MTGTVDTPLWNRKAVAFVVRSHRQLWGRNNEDPLAWIFQNGFKNAFIKQMMIGWNKHDQSRTLDDWGLALPRENNAAYDSVNRIVLPAGLVIPWIVDKQLLKITLYQHEGPATGTTHVVQGSLPVAMILGAPCPKVAVVPDIIDGLWLHQENSTGLCVVIPHTLKLPMDDRAGSIILQATRLLFLSKKPEQLSWPLIPAGLAGQPITWSYSDIRMIPDSLI